jgi:hypothetical protein
VRDRWSRVSSQKKGDKGDPYQHVGCRSHVEPETGSGGLFIQLDHSSVLHRPFHGQIKSFKGTEEIKAVWCIIWAGFVGSVLRLSSIFQTQSTGEKVLETGIPSVFQGNIILDIVGMGRDDEYCILSTSTKYIYLVYYQLFQVF